MHVFSIVNQKGGVGKTTTSINLLTSLAYLGKKCLLIDLDPQGNSTTGLGIGYDRRQNNIYQVLIGERSIKSSIQKTSVENFYIITSTMDLSGAEQEIVSVSNWQNILQQKIQEISRDFDYIIIDCPPSLGVLTVISLMTCDSIIIPVQCEFFALEGLVHLLETIDLIKKKMSKKLRVDGILLTMHDKRNKLCLQVAEDLRQNFPRLVYKTVIPRNVRLSEAPSHGIPAMVYDVHCAGSKAYEQLAHEMIKRELAEVS